MRAEGEWVELAAVKETARRILALHRSTPFTAVMKDEEYQDLARAFLDLLHPAPQPPLARDPEWPLVDEC